MSHPFENKLFAFIGTPVRCTRRQACEALDVVGGVVDERISSFTEYVVAFQHDGKSKKYAKAVKEDSRGFLALLDESQFFDIIEGKELPPKRSELAKPSLINIPLRTEEEIARHDEAWLDILNIKRMNNMAKYGVTMPDGSIAKIDVRPLDQIRRILELMKAQPDKWGFVITDTPHDACDNCGKPTKVHIDDNSGNELVKLCEHCYNVMMAEYTGAVMPVNVPKHITVEDNKGKAHKFELEFMIFANAKSLTAIGLGELRYKAEVHGELYVTFEEMLKRLKSKIKELISTKHIDDNGYILDGRAVGYIDYNRKRDACDIIIDGKPYTWEQLEKNISSHEGWVIKIEFGDFDDILE